MIVLRLVPLVLKTNEEYASLRQGHSMCFFFDTEAKLRQFGLGSRLRLGPLDSAQLGTNAAASYLASYRFSHLRSTARNDEPAHDARRMFKRSLRRKVHS